MKKKLARPEDSLVAIATDNGKLFKENYIRSLAKQGDNEFFKGVRLALDKFDTYGVKKIPERTGPDGPGVTMEMFAGLCEQLAARELTGNDALTQIEFVMKHSTNHQWNDWYRRILMRDLKAGFSEKTVNNACEEFPDYQIPIFSCQLANDLKNAPEKARGKKLIDIKLDGSRVLTFLYPNGTVEQFSRNGKPIDNFPTIRKEMESLCVGLPEPFVVDGEMMSATFQDLMKQWRRKTNVDTKDAVYYVFDILTLREFKNGEGFFEQTGRRKILDKFIDDHEDDVPHVRAVAWEEIDLDTKEGQTRLKEWNAVALEQDPDRPGKTRYEGLMLKDPKGLYETKRSDNWLKMKPVYTVTLPIVDMEEGKSDTKYVGMMGAVICDGHDGDDPRRIAVNVGIGWSDIDRERLWKVWKKNPNALKGVLLDIDCDGVTQDQKGNYSLRFPRVKTFRGFKPGEKI